jgi:hypothetical protein
MRTAVLCSNFSGVTRNVSRAPDEKKSGTGHGNGREREASKQVDEN